MWEICHSYPVAYLGGGALGDAPPLWPEHKIFLNTLNQKKISDRIDRRFIYTVIKNYITPVKITIKFSTINLP